MVYARGLDNSWREQPAVDGLSAAGFRVYVDSILYVVEGETDGHLPATALGTRGRRAAAELVAAGLWQTADDGWHLTQWTRHGTARANREKTRAAATQRQQRHRKGGPC